MKEFANLSIENETSGSNQGSTSVQMREKRIHDASGEDHGENSDLSTFPSKIGTVDVAKKWYDTIFATFLEPSLISRYLHLLVLEAQASRLVVMKARKMNKTSST